MLCVTYRISIYIVQQCIAFVEHNKHVVYNSALHTQGKA